MTTVLQVADSVVAQLNAADFDHEFIAERLQTGTQSSIRFRVRLIESGREVTTTVEAVSITRRDLSADPNSTLFTKSASSVQATLTTFLIVP